MTATHASNSKGDLLMFLVAAILVGGAVVGLVLGGLGGMIWWFVGLTFFALAFMVVSSL